MRLGVFTQTLKESSSSYGWLFVLKPLKCLHHFVLIVWNPFNEILGKEVDWVTFFFVRVLQLCTAGQPPEKCLLKFLTGNKTILDDWKDFQSFQLVKLKEINTCLNLCIKIYMKTFLLWQYTCYNQKVSEAVEIKVLVFPFWNEIHLIMFNFSDLDYGVSKVKLE